MIRNLEDMGREEIIQYITLVINYFYNTYDYFTREEKEYINEYIEILEKVYNLGEKRI